MKLRNRYPIYIPSKNRADVCHTARFFLADGVPFKIVIEPSQVESYAKHYDKKLLLVLPDDNLQLLGARLWIREHSIAAGHDRHWQFDDNIYVMYRLFGGRRLPCNSMIAIAALEEFTDRYENIGVSGFNYEMFTMPHYTKPFQLNCHVYSASLINNRMPHKWRLFYNDDTDLCLQVLTNNLCTVLFNAFCVKKIRTMKVKGGNTQELYMGDGRLRMARTLEEMWPQFVTTRWRFGRPQHVIKNNWKCFKTQLRRRSDLNWQEIEKKEFPIELRELQKPKSKSLQAFVRQYRSKRKESHMHDNN